MFPTISKTNKIPVATSCHNRDLDKFSIDNFIGTVKGYSPYSALPLHGLAQIMVKRPFHSQAP